MLHPSPANLSNSAPHLISRDTELRSLSRSDRWEAFQLYVFLVASVRSPSLAS
jgi:hypothetical protein